MRVASFDLGPRSTSLCVLDSSESPGDVVLERPDGKFTYANVLHWEIWDLGSTGAEVVARKFARRIFDESAKCAEGVDVVVCETQLSRATVNKVMQCVLAATYELRAAAAGERGPTVRFMPAKRKFDAVEHMRPTDLGRFTKTTQNKTGALRIAERLVETSGQWTAALAAHKHKQRTDCADALLQAVTTIDAAAHKLPPKKRRKRTAAEDDEP